MKVWVVKEESREFGRDLTEGELGEEVDQVEVATPEEADERFGSANWVECNANRKEGPLQIGRRLLTKIIPYRLPANEAGRE